MPLVLPDFKGTSCLGIDVCGDLGTEDKGILDLIEKNAGRSYIVY